MFTIRGKGGKMLALTRGKGRGMENFCNLDQENALRRRSSSENGLTPEEAAARLGTYGENRLEGEKKTPLPLRFLKQLGDPMVLILLAAAVVSALTSRVSGESGADVLIILFVVLLNATLGVVQESKAEQALEALRKLTPAVSSVVRNGTLLRVPAETLVPGDIVRLEAGDAVPADGRLLEAVSLKIEEAALTGESVPADKTDGVLPDTGGKIPLGDRRNMAYMGSGIVYGRGTLLVTETGMNTEMGRIAGALSRAESGETPLQQKLAKLSKTLTVLVLGICVAMFAIGILREGNFSLQAITSTFMLAVSLAVAAIPEGLVAVVTVVLSIGVTKMSKSNAIIRRLSSVETLGCTQIICTDKTGTLTQNRMTVVAHTGNTELLASALCLCTDAVLPAAGTPVGEPTECALVVYASSLGLDKNVLSRAMPRVGEAPFDSRRKMMTTVHREKGRFIQFTKGAPDVILRRSTLCLTGGAAVPMTDAMRREFLAQNEAYAKQALRVLACAYRVYREKPRDFTPDALETDMVYIGLAGMMDPVRPEVREAVICCQAAGIRPVMITGDHKDTAAAIGKTLGILQSPAEAMTGTELDALSDSELKDQIGRYSVFARVQPEHKVRIVEAWKKKGMVTAMTGDGVNDAPAVKAADIGIGMGRTGTDVTKNVADMILADDNFATIVRSVEEGRRVYDNIRKAIHFLLSSNMSEVLCIFVATLSGYQVLLPVHLLFINLITDSLPALALGLEKGEPDLMRRKPRPRQESLFADGVGWSCIYQGIMVTLLTLTAFLCGISGRLRTGGQENPLAAGMTMAFLTMSMAEIFHSYNMRSQFHSIFRLKTHNFWLFGAMLLSLCLTTLVIFTPSLASLLHFEKICLAEYFAALALALLVIPIVEFAKAITGRGRKIKP